MSAQRQVESEVAATIPQVMPVPHCHESLMVRICRKPVAMIRNAYWRRRLASMGPRSHIDHADNISGTRSIWIGRSVRIWWGARIEAMCGSDGCRCITIGDGTRILPYVHIGAVSSVEIGCGVLIASRVYITDHDHDFSDPDDPPVQNGRLVVAPVRIGDYVWLGEGVMVLKGVQIGERSIIGAGSIVTRDIPPYAIAVGSPARVIRRYNQATRQWERVD